MTNDKRVLKNKLKTIALAFYECNLDSFLKGRINGERMKQIFKMYFIDEINTIEIASEVNLSQARVNQIVNKIVFIIERNFQKEAIRNEKIRIEAEKVPSLERKIKNIFINIEKSKGIEDDVYLMDMDLSNRAYNCLSAARVKTAKDICNFSEEELKRFRNMGNRSIQEIKGVLAFYGLELRK